MTNTSHDPMIRLLRQALPPIEAGPTAGELWPRVRTGLVPGVPPPSTAEWILVAAVTLTCLFQPATLSVLLFHF
ncbi:hypothetical protein BH18ACI5_BH18ACI5_05360 [soil metagenome]